MFVYYENFESYHHELHVSINDYQIEFEQHVSKHREFQIILPESVLAYHALKSTNLSPENERLIRATITNLTLSDIAQQLKNINGNSTLVNISQQPISLKKEIEVVRPKMKYDMVSTLSTNKLFSVVVGPKAPTTTRKVHIISLFITADLATFVHANFTMGTSASDSKTNNNKRQTTENMVLLNECENDYRTDNATKTCKEIANEALLNQEKLDNSTFPGLTIISAILDSGATTTICGKKWLDCFLETLSKKEKKIPTQLDTKTFKFVDGIK